MIEITPDELVSLINDSVNIQLQEFLTHFTPIQPKESLYTIQEASEFLNLSVPTIYSKVSRGEIPVMKQGKRLYFSSVELMQFIKDGRRKTNSEIEAEAIKPLKK